MVSGKQCSFEDYTRYDEGHGMASGSSGRPQRTRRRAGGKKPGGKKPGKPPPKKPPKKPAAPAGDGGDDEGHQQRLQETHAKIDAALEAVHLTDEQRQEYRESVRAVIGRLTPAGLARVHAHVTEYKFYRSHAELTAALRAKYPKLKTRGLKGAFDKDGTCHMDGGGLIEDRPAKLQEFHAHELSHAIDGTQHELTKTKEWHDAWVAEVQNQDFLGENAKKSPREGWGDFGAMILGGEVTPQEAKDIFPRCVKVWQSEGLL
jgi:hypothetical protein